MKHPLTYYYSLGYRDGFDGVGPDLITLDGRRIVNKGATEYLRGHAAGIAKVDEITKKYNNAPIRTSMKNNV